MKQIAITVLMPCKDFHVPYIREAADSVFHQSSSLWNLIFVDESTRPETLAFLEEYTHCSDERVSVVRNESRFVTGALNTGMRHATTPYVCSLHCDDRLDIRAVEILSGYIERYPNVDFFHTSRQFIDDDGIFIGTVMASRDSFDLSDFKHLGPVKHLHCWKVDAAFAIGGMDEALGLHGADDYDFPWCMAEAGSSFKAIPECLYYKRDHRTHSRLTTHVPLEIQINELRKIWTKHGMTEQEQKQELQTRKAGYLMQAMYLNDEDKRKKNEANFDIRQSWRQIIK